MPILGTDDTIRYDNMAISDNSDNEHVSPGPCYEDSHMTAVVVACCYHRG